MAEHIDLDGYPIIRLDQVRLLDTDTLMNASRDAFQLQLSLSEDTVNGPIPPMVSYLKKQLHIMNTEIAKRAASERIDSLLQSKNIQEDMKLTFSKRREHVVADRMSENLSPRATVSAPSSLIDAKMPPSVSLVEAPIAETSASVSSSASSAFVPLPLPSELRKQKIVASDDDDQSGIGNGDALGEGASIMPHRVSSNSSNSRRPRSGANDSISRKAQTVINQQFGNSFIVAPIEKRKRFYPQKKEAPEVTVEKERQERLDRLDSTFLPH
jgi:hypothetical protein